MIINNTIADNDSFGGSGVWSSSIPENRFLNNIIVAKSGQLALSQCTPGSVFQFNLVHAPSGAAYEAECQSSVSMPGNILADPLFVDPSRGNYSLRAASPAIDAASEGTIAALISEDIGGNPRIGDGDGNGTATLDIGAYEYTSLPPQLSVSSNADNLGTFFEGNAAVTRTVTISNTGPAAAAVIFATVASNDAAAFSLQPGGPNPCASLSPTLGAGTNCTLTLAFTPASFGTKKGSVVVMSDALGSPAMTWIGATVLPADTTPDAIVFAPQTDVALSTIVTSNSVTVSGISVPVPISISGGEYSVNGGPFTSTPGMVESGQTVVVRLMSSSRYSSGASALLAVGDGGAVFNVATLIRDVFPDAVVFAAQNAVPRSTLVTSNVVTPTGFDVPVPISITGGEYSINGGPFTASAGTLIPGQSLSVRVMSPESYGTTQNARI